MPDHSVASALLNVGAVGFQPQQPITFKSGIISPVYVDNRRLPFHPEAWHTVIEAFAEVTQADFAHGDVIAGVAVGGVPHSAALSYVLRRPSVFVRKEAKGHGKQQLIEGGDVAGRRVLLIEDLVTTGSSSLAAVDALRAAQAEVIGVLAIVQYGFREAAANFAAAGVPLRTLTHFSAILDEALSRGALNEAQAAVVRDWFSDPHGWAARQGFAI
ncbi:MAG: orotate phosphoribosyltransferase [Anaerolineae bacterium]